MTYCKQSLAVEGAQHGTAEEELIAKTINI